MRDDGFRGRSKANALSSFQRPQNKTKYRIVSKNEYGEKFTEIHIFLKLRFLHKCWKMRNDFRDAVNSDATQECEKLWVSYFWWAVYFGKKQTITVACFSSLKPPTCFSKKLAPTQNSVESPGALEGRPESLQLINMGPRLGTSTFLKRKTPNFGVFLNVCSEDSP